MKLFGLTGGIGSGKTVVAHRLSEMGYPVYNTDQAAQRIMHDNLMVRSQIELLFGSDIYVHDKLNRQKVASLVFNDPVLLHKLNSIVHPAVIFDIRQWCKQFTDIAFVESAIMFESQIDQLCTAVICITADTELRIERTMKRDNCTRQQVINRINNQMSEAERIAKSDFTVSNDQKEISDICLDILNFCRNFAA